MTTEFSPLEEDALVNAAYFEKLTEIVYSSSTVTGLALAQHEERPELVVMVEFSVMRSAIGALFFQWPSKIIDRLREVSRENAPEGVSVSVIPFYHFCCMTFGGPDAE